MTSMFHIYVAILLFFIKGSCGNDVDLSKISYTIIEELTERFIKFSLDSKDWQIMLSCVSCEVKEDLSINCKGEETLKVNVELKKGDISFIVPYNVSCDNKNDHVTRDLTSTSTIESIELVWTKSDLSINTYIISFFESYKYEHKIITTNDSKYTLKDLKEKTLYRMCIATINNQYITGKYMCIDKLTDFAETGPVEAIVITPSSDSAELSWKKPLYKEDNPEGYVVQYSEQSRKCGIVFISMGLSRMKETGSCDIKKHEAWVDLESLKLTNLKPYTKYSIIIYPINGNKIINEKKDEFQTKEGESGPVSNINKEFVKDWLRINFDKPKNENGVVTKYKINLYQQRLGICKNINKEIFSKSDFTRNSNYIINSNEMEKCAEYRVEIYPINGWSHNSGIGQMAYITFKYEAETTLSVSKLDSKFISSNMIRISWEDPVEQEHCKEISYLIKVMNKENKDDCKNLIIYNQTCKEFITITQKDSNCDLKEVFPEKIGHSSTIYYVNDFKSNLYEISVSKITFSSHLQTNPSRIVKLKEDCFTDCYSSTYKGIRSNTGCIRWNDSPRYSNYYTGNNFFCQMASSTTPWCPTKESWKKCEVPKCSKIITSSECVKDIRSDISTTKIDLSWTSPYYKDAVIGFITLVYGRDNTCEQCHVQLCEKCPSEAQLSSQIKNFYTFCKTTETRYINNKATLNNLNNDEDYIVFIIPLLSINLAGSVKQSSFRTLLAKPGIPQNVKVVTKSTTFITFIWDKLTKTADKGLPEYYESILYESQSKKNVQKTNYENVYFSGLNMCTKYCLHVYATNKAGNSKDKGYICDYTYAPGLGEVKVKNIDDDPSSYREISWLYSKDDPCHKSYRVIYKDIFSSTHTAVEINSTRTIIKHLTLNTFYAVTVRAESQLQTSNNQSLGKYSDEVRFYTGKVRPDIKDYKENILAQRTKVNISWSFDNSSNGSIFQFIVIILNSSNHCLNLVNLVCKDCPPQYSVKHLDDNEKKKRTELLKYTNKISNFEKIYMKDNYTLSHLFTMNTSLKNFSVEIYAINLKGVHKVYGQKSIYKEDSANSAIISMIGFVVLFFIIILIIFIVILKVKKRPSFIYKSIIHSKKPKIESTEDKNSKRNEKSLSMSSRFSVSKKIADDSGKCTSVISNEILPPIEQRRRNCIVTLKEFHAYYQKMNENKSDLIIQEYKKLSAESKQMEHDLGLTVNVGKLASNAKKNRFVNILPFDKTRVKIKDSGTNNDYINANYIPFTEVNDKYEYIASQGPIDNSINDFWQMISDQNINCIIMLTRTMEDEKFKCLQYWPENVGEEQSFGKKDEIVVSLENEVESESHLERVFIMKDKKVSEERRIVQLHMHTWSDHSAPNLEYFDKLLFRFHEIVSSSATNPYLIHCSAGVGRTGTLICIDRIIKQLVSGNQTIDIYGTVLNLRHYRNFMVQRQAQYVFIHDYIEHFLNKYMKMDDTDEMLYFNDD